MPRIEEDLLVLSCLEPLSAAEAQRFDALASTPGLDWALVGRLAQVNKVEPRLTATLKTRGAWRAVPPDVAGALAEEAARVADANRRRVARAREVLAAFAAEKVDVCLLKGVLFAETLYRDPLYKRMNDVDLLVHAGDLPRIVELYRRLGYFSIAERVANRPELNRKVSHHLPPFVSRELDCLLGTQWGLKSPLAGLELDHEAMWRRSEPFEYHGVPARRLSSRDNLLHLCIHLGVFKSGLRDLMDIANLVRQESGRIDWPAFVGDVRRAGAQSLVVHALMLVSCIAPHPEAQRALEALRPEARGFYLSAARKKAASTSVLLRACSGHLSTVEKNVSAFNVARHFPEKSRLFGAFWRSVLLAPAPECARVVFDPEAEGAAALRARALAPAQLLRAIGAEIGTGLLALLLVKSVVDLGTAFVRWPFGSAGQDDLAAYARSLGLTLQDLERVKNGIY